MYPTPYDLLTVRQRAQLDQLAADERRSNISAVCLWLRHGASDREGRVQLGARIMASSVYAQACALGLVSCGRCGDVGCGYCTSVNAAVARAAERKRRTMAEGKR